MNFLCSRTQCMKHSTNKIYIESKERTDTWRECYLCEHAQHQLVMLDLQEYLLTLFWATYLLQHKL